MSDTLLERSKIYLLHADKNDVCLYDHMSELILQLIATKPGDALEKFEEFSKSLKESLFVQQPFKQVALDEKKAPDVLDFLISNAVNKGRELLKAQLGEIKVKIPNLIEESFYFSRLGIGLGQEETSQIYFHIKNYFSTLPLKNARFFGKIYGIEKNYYVVEAEPITPTSLPPYVDDYAAPAASAPVKEEEEPPAPLGEVDPDEPKTPPPKPVKPVENPPPEIAEERTPNQYVYYISYGPAQPWIRLPDVTPDLIRASRLFAKVFTGDLNALVSDGYPTFPGVEKHLLRAQLARILHATTVLPRPFVPEGAGEEEQGDDAPHGYISIAEGNYPQNVNVNTLAEENQWVHSRPPILVQGRVRKWPLPKADGEAEEEKEGENAGEEAVEPGEDGLGVDLKAVKGIEEDTKITAGRHVIIPSFSFRRDNVVPDSPLLLKSNFWPGSYTMAYGGAKAKLASIYIGNGTKYTALPYTAPPPPELPEEYPDLDEKIDPTVDEEDRARAAQEESQIDADKGQEEEEPEEPDDEI